MNVLGIVAEYNPFHKGHIYHISESKRLTSADAVICAMSGNYVQRGEPAILDKWRRTKAALENGVDVVFEIPVYYCLGNASTYAVAGVGMLESTGIVTHLSFGSESGDLDAIKRVAENLERDTRKMVRLFRAYVKEGMSFPTAREAAYTELHVKDPGYEKELEILRSSNDILAIEYLRALTSLEPVAVKRVGAHHDMIFDEEVEYQSASAIRAAMREGKDISKYVPGGYDLSRLCSYDDKWFDAIRYAIISSSPEKIDRCPHGGEGIAHRLRNSVRYASSLDELILYTKSKRYTYTHIARLILEVLLGVDRESGIPYNPGYLRLLGFTDRGRELLSQMKSEGLNKVPVITNINKQWEQLDVPAQKSLELDIHASDIYNLLNGNDLTSDSEYTSMPVIFDRTENDDSAKK